jgi:P-type Cu+ transporter
VDDRSVHIEVKGMTCAACSGAVERALAAEPGVTLATVNLLQHSAQVTYNPALTSPAVLANAIEDCGFEAKANAPNATSGLQTASLDITGMHCAACSTAVENALRKLKGVASAEVNLLTHSAQVKYATDLTGPRDIIAEIEDCGFDATLSSDPSAGASAFAANNRAVKDASSLLYASLIFSIPIVLIGKVGMLSPTMGAPLRAEFMGFPIGALLQWILATPVQFVIAWHFHVGAVASLRRRSANMDVLVSLGTFASYLYASVSLLHSHFSIWGIRRASLFDCC